MRIPVVDLFAGAGGLCEGFSSLRDDRGSRVFDVRLSIEKDSVAHATLSLRALFRSFDEGCVPEVYYQYIRGEISKQAFDATPDIRRAREAVASEARLAELGKVNPAEVDRWITEVISGHSEWVLTGGPPCQAYSLAGRSRMRGKDPKKFESDERHLLYREYLRVLTKFSPSVFVMENVKGILTSSHSGGKIFEKIIRDLKRPSRGIEYQIRSFVVPGEITNPADFVIKSENYGVPQCRHRVILLGIRKDIIERIKYSGVSPDAFVLEAENRISVGEVIGDLPKLRSRLTRRVSSRLDSRDEWYKAIQSVGASLANCDPRLSKQIMIEVKDASKSARSLIDFGGRFIKWESIEDDLKKSWYLDPRLGGVTLHESRGHMESDLGRYLYAASFSKIYGYSPKLSEFPKALLPAHANVKLQKIPFNDRFRVQLKQNPGSTIVSHIAKDGHYYIHYDAPQCRSLTVREAARIQTFPDNYFFEGNRTQQYHQVGNAVPPLLAKKLAGVVKNILDGAR